MPKLSCPCGFVHNLSPISDDGWITIRDQEYESVIDAERTLYEIAGDSTPARDHPRITEYQTAQQRIVSAWGRLYACPKCERLMWQRHNGRAFEIFTLEKGEV